MVSGGSEPVHPPCSIKVLCDLRPWRTELKGKRAYLVAYDAERLRKVAHGIGIDAKSASDKWIARDCLCSDRIPLKSLGSAEEVTINLQPVASEEGISAALLRIVVISKHQDQTDWTAIGDPVVVQTTSAHFADRKLYVDIASQIEAETKDSEIQTDGISVKEKIDDLVQHEDWWTHLPERIPVEMMMSISKFLNYTIRSRGLDAATTTATPTATARMFMMSANHTKSIKKLEKDRDYQISTLHHQALEERDKVQKELDLYKFKAADEKHKLEKMLADSQLQADLAAGRHIAEKSNNEQKAEEVERHRKHEASAFEDSERKRHALEDELRQLRLLSDAEKSKANEELLQKEQETKKLHTDKEAELSKAQEEMAAMKKSMKQRMDDEFHQRGSDELRHKAVLRETENKLRSEADKHSALLKETEEKLRAEAEQRHQALHKEADEKLKAEADKLHKLEEDKAMAEGTARQLQMESDARRVALEETADLKKQLAALNESSEHDQQRRQTEEKVRRERDEEVQEKTEAIRGELAEELRQKNEMAKKSQYGAEEIAQTRQEFQQELDALMKSAQRNRELDEKRQLQTEESLSETMKHSDQALKRKHTELEELQEQSRIAAEESRQQAERELAEMRQELEQREQLLLKTESDKKMMADTLYRTEADTESFKRSQTLELSTRIAQMEEAQKLRERESQEQHSEELQQLHKQLTENTANRRSAAEKKATHRTRLRVKIIKANDLRAADIGGKSDPYVVCQVKNRPRTKFKTDIVKKSLNPVWDHEHVVDAVALDDALEFQVYDHDLGKADDFLGWVLLNPEEFRPAGFDGTLKLHDAGKKNEATLTVSLQVLPLKRARAFLVIKSANALRAADVNGKSDPYCVISIPGKPLSVCKTKVAKKTLSPTWNEEFELQDYLPGDPIDFVVMDHDPVGPGDFLGSANLNGDAFYPEGYDDELTLEDKGTRLESTLHVSIDIEGP